MWVAKELIHGIGWYAMPLLFIDAIMLHHLVAAGIQHVCTRTIRPHTYQSVATIVYRGDYIAYLIEMSHLMCLLIIAEHAVVLGADIDILALHGKLSERSILRQLLGNIDGDMLTCLRLITMDGITAEEINLSVIRLHNLANRIVQFHRTATHRNTLGLLAIIGKESISATYIENLAICKETLRM